MCARIVWALAVAAALCAMAPRATAQDATPTPSIEPPLAGINAPELPVGDPNTLAIVAIGEPVRGTVPVALRNNTGDGVLLRDITGVARDERGELVAVANHGTVAPVLVRAGGIAVAAVYFGPSDLASGLSFELDPETRPADEQTSRADLIIDEVAIAEDGRLLGIARNEREAPFDGPNSVMGLCFDADGAIRGYYAAYTSKDAVEPGATTPFAADFYGTGPCDGVVVGASGWLADG